MLTELYSITDVAQAFQLPVSTLRFYDDNGLVRATVRRSRVRYYDHDALVRLAYVLLWRFDGMLSVEDTRAIVASGDGPHRNQMIDRCRGEILDRIARLTDALASLDHMMQCASDDPMCCQVGRSRLDNAVDEALGRLVVADPQRRDKHMADNRLRNPHDSNMEGYR